MNWNELRKDLRNDYDFQGIFSSCCFIGIFVNFRVRFGVFKAGPNATVGWITKVYGPVDMQNLAPECLGPINQSRVASDKFVQIKEPRGRRARYIPAHVPDGLDVKIGDEVEIEPVRCQNGLIPEVKKVFK
jgi:hypothetical protein